MIGIYYGNGWNSRSLPFMSTNLLMANGTSYPVDDVFVGGVLDKTALAKYGLPKLTGTFAFAMFMANAAVSTKSLNSILYRISRSVHGLITFEIGALIVHCFLFWGKDIYQAFKKAREGRFDDRHHAHMAKHYKEAPWWWYVLLLVISFVLGLLVVLKEGITLPVWAYLVSLVVGIIISPFVSYLQI